MLDYNYCSLNIVFCPYLQEWWSLIWQGMKLRQSWWSDIFPMGLFGDYARQMGSLVAGHHPHTLISPSPFNVIRLCTDDNTVSAAVTLFLD